MRVSSMSWSLNQSANVPSPTSFLPCDGRLIWCITDILLVVLGLIVVLQALLCAVVCGVSCVTCRRLKAKIRRLNKAVNSLEAGTADTGNQHSQQQEETDLSAYCPVYSTVNKVKTCKQSSINDPPDIPTVASEYSEVYKTELLSVAAQEYHNVNTESSNDLYWAPGSTIKEIRSQMSQKKTKHSLQFQAESISLLEELGKGEFGVVYKGEWVDAPQGALQVAVKSLCKQEEENKYKLLKEAAIMGQFSHPHVVRLYGVVDQADKVLLVMEYLPNGDLRNHLLQAKDSHCQRLTPLQLLTFCQEIANAMDYLSKKGFIHRDLAARNILLNEEYNCKIADFGMSRDMEEDNYYKSKGGQIPVRWTAPEAIMYRKYTTKSDVWSYGMVMYEIWSLGCKPFEELSFTQITVVIETGYCQPPPPGCPRNVYKLMVDCWHPEHHSRPTFEDITGKLAGDPEVILSWSEADKAASSKAVALGAPLEEGQLLYEDLQQMYK